MRKTYRQRNHSNLATVCLCFLYWMGSNHFIFVVFQFLVLLLIMSIFSVVTMNRTLVRAFSDCLILIIIYIFGQKPMMTNATATSCWNIGYMRKKKKFPRWMLRRQSLSDMIYMKSVLCLVCIVWLLLIELNNILTWMSHEIEKKIHILSANFRKNRKISTKSIAQISTKRIFISSRK